MYYNLRMVYITTPDKVTAKNLGRKILEKRLAACVNIVDGIPQTERLCPGLSWTLPGTPLDTSG